MKTKLIAVTVRNTISDDSKNCEIKELNEITEYLKENKWNIDKSETKIVESNNSFFTILYTLNKKGIRDENVETVTNLQI
ncbi:hypothetical protein MC378_14040 [Polaribacter sp. MSW13]|uniref:Uncharacterized protein n=1 Tax=Polaribacter marinus TaxID=2916838 RepID=A0A9X2AMK1_9FLAO|nr:hypothetical protein [Polaribacter marinus]MCI2230295.1 hypothetical protein [Polaribacter marinus]